MTDQIMSPDDARSLADLLKAEQFEPDEPRTAADVLQEATRYVNWMPDEKHAHQARYDALGALMHIYAYSTAVALETLRRIDPAAAERVARHIGRDDWDAYCENAWIWHEALAKGEPIDPDSFVFTKLAGAHNHPPRCCCPVYQVAPDDHDYEPLGGRIAREIATKETQP